jgi:beta-glucanase (GH16 family)
VQVKRFHSHFIRIPQRRIVESTFQVLLLAFFAIVASIARAANPTGRILVWSDEFTGANGSSVDPAKWSFDIGGKGWGNNELETYTNRTANVDVEDGFLVITALKETFSGPDNITRAYTSARLVSRNKFSQAYGRFEARIKIPYGQGIWPAFWMLGDNIGTAGWPHCGEIDIMENIGREPSFVHGTLHGPGYSGGNGISASYALPKGRKFSDDFHSFAVEWEPNVVRFYVDGRLYKTRTPADLPAGSSWVFDHPFFIILNVAVGGGWPGNPDTTTVFPQKMLVDYVRVYRLATSASVPVRVSDESRREQLSLGLYNRSINRVGSDFSLMPPFRIA